MKENNDRGQEEKTRVAERVLDMALVWAKPWQQSGCPEHVQGQSRVAFQAGAVLQPVRYLPCPSWPSTDLGLIPLVSHMVPPARSNF